MPDAFHDMAGVGLSDLRSRFRGRLVVAGDDDYDSARRVWNGNIDKRPAVIARCMGVADVMEAVKFARANALLVPVRGGGHNAAGYGLRRRDRH
jgi:FAD/FMN-containing dehydrogenase